MNVLDYEKVLRNRILKFTPCYKADHLKNLDYIQLEKIAKRLHLFRQVKKSFVLKMYGEVYEGAKNEK